VLLSFPGLQNFPRTAILLKKHWLLVTVSSKYSFSEFAAYQCKSSCKKTFLPAEIVVSSAHDLIAELNRFVFFQNNPGIPNLHLSRFMRMSFSIFACLSHSM
jgi:hypothetical protein